MIEYISQQQAAVRLGVTRAAVNYWVKKGTLPTIDVAGHPLIPMKAFEEFARTYTPSPGFQPGWQKKKRS